MRLLKKLIASSIFIGITISLYSQNYIVVQHGTSLSQFSKLDSAIVHAQNGDYLYLSGGFFTISQSINKKLFIYGAGHYPDSTLATSETAISGTIRIVMGADSGLLSGVHCYSNIKFGTNTSNQTIHTYMVSRCRIDDDIALGYDTYNSQSNGICFFENVITGDYTAIDGHYVDQVLFEKNIIDCQISHFNNSYFRNNIFLSLYSAAVCNFTIHTSAVFGIINYNPIGISGCTFENNIILEQEPLRFKNYTGLCSSSYTHYTCGLSNFKNNLFVFNQSFPAETNIGSNNIVNQSQSSIFVNHSGATFSYSHDYHLKSTCAGKNAGTDGTDIGIYGTGQPYKPGAVPANPHIQSKAITIDNNIIHVNVKVAAQGH
ncbi:MAG: hypothetical protein WCI71_09415 [Bacteroidota bacterium]